MHRHLTLRRIRSGRALVALLIVLMAVGSVAFVVTRQHAEAQPPAGPPQGPPMMNPIMPNPFMPMMPGGGGGIAMIAHEGFIYIAQGGTLYKIDPETMTLAGELQYLQPMAGMMGRPGPMPPPAPQ